MAISHHHHHHIVLAARISLTLSRHSSLSFIALGRSSGQQPVSSHSCWMYVRAGRPAFARPCVGIHKSTSLMSSCKELICKRFYVNVINNLKNDWCPRNQLPNFITYCVRDYLFLERNLYAWIVLYSDDWHIQP